MITPGAEVPRRALIGTAGLGISTLLLPSATAAASNVQTLSCGEAIPFIAQGSSTTVGDVSVTATLNTAIAPPTGFEPDGYLHAGGPFRAGDYAAGQTTTLTFDQNVPLIEVRTEFLDDGSAAKVVESYTFTGRDGDGTALFTRTITNQDVTTILPADGPAAGLVSLEIVQSATGIPSSQYASIVYLRIPTC